MRLADEAIVGIFAAIHRAHAIKLAHQDRGQKVIYRGGVARPPIQHAFEFLDRAVIFQIVKMVEGGVDQRIVLGKTAAACSTAPLPLRACTMASEPQQATDGQAEQRIMVNQPFHQYQTQLHPHALALECLV